jgi:hypothetical protein
MWCFTDRVALYLSLDGDGCYAVFHGYALIGTVCQTACELEFEDPLWGAECSGTPRIAARLLYQQHTEMIEHHEVAIAAAD